MELSVDVVKLFPLRNGSLPCDPCYLSLHGRSKSVGLPPASDVADEFRLGQRSYKCILKHLFPRVSTPTICRKWKKVKEISSLGVDFISIGSLTHSYKSVDMSMEFLE